MKAFNWPAEYSSVSKMAAKLSCDIWWCHNNGDGDKLFYQRLLLTLSWSFCFICDDLRAIFVGLNHKKCSPYLGNFKILASQNIYLPICLYRGKVTFFVQHVRVCQFSMVRQIMVTFKRSKTVISLVIRSFQEVNIPVCVVSAETKFSANFYRNPCCVRVFFFNKKGW